MKTFKITNITHLLKKTHSNYNSNLSIEYVDGITRKKIEIKPNNELYLTTSSLSMSIRRLRVRGLISVINTNPKTVNDEPTSEVVLPKTEKGGKKEPKELKKNIIDNITVVNETKEVSGEITTIGKSASPKNKK